MAANHLTMGMVVLVVTSGSASARIAEPEAEAALTKVLSVLALSHGGIVISITSKRVLN
jgi:hypothetical protein